MYGVISTYNEEQFCLFFPPTLMLITYFSYFIVLAKSLTKCPIMTGTMSILAQFLTLIEVTSVVHYQVIFAS